VKGCFKDTVRIALCDLCKEYNIDTEQLNRFEASTSACLASVLTVIFNSVSPSVNAINSTSTSFKGAENQMVESMSGVLAVVAVAAYVL